MPSLNMTTLLETDPGISSAQRFIWSRSLRHWMPTRAVPSKNQGMIRKLERRWLRRVKLGLFDTQEDEELFQLAKDAWNWSSKFDRPRISPQVCFHKLFLSACVLETLVDQLELYVRSV